MILSRLWYALLAFAFGGAVFLLFLAQEVTNRSAQRTAGQLLTSASRAVGWYLKDDARTRAAALLPIAIDKDVRESLVKSSASEDFAEVKSDVREKSRTALRAYQKEMADGGLVFDALWVVDVHGRVVASVGYERGTGSENFEMGGYALVADATHGWIRDDAWVFGRQIFRVVARPVESQAQSPPVGAVVAAKIVDDAFCQDIAERTGAAVAFFANQERVASGAPPSFDKSVLEVHKADFEQLATDENYQELGRTSAIVLRENAGFDVSAIFARLPGEAWDLGAGYVVGHRSASIADPMEFQRQADQKDKDAVPLAMIVLVSAGAALLGLFFSVLEHTMPLSGFKRALAQLADKGSDVDVLKPSTFRSTYKKLAALVNDALDKIAAQQGVDRGPADLQSVLGPLPVKPQMSAFAVPGDVADKPQRRPTLPAAALQAERDKALGSGVGGSGAAGSGASALAAMGTAPRDVGDGPLGETVPGLGTGPQGGPDPAALPASREPGDGLDDGPPKRATPPRKKRPEASAGASDEEEEAQWHQVYADFIEMKQRFGEPTQKLTYEKFRGTLQRNKEALMERHGCTRVTFRVYEKQGRAALKASPVK